MRPPLSRVPAMPAAAGIAMGIVAASQGFWLLGAVAGAIGFVWLYLSGRHYLSFFFLMEAVGALLLMAGMPAAMPQWASGRQGIFCGEVESMEPSASGRWVCVARIDSMALAGAKVPEGWQPFLCQIIFRDAPDDVEPGATISYQGRISKIVDDTTALPHSDFFNQALLRQGITGKAYVYDNKVEVLEPPYGLKHWAWHMRGRMHNAIVANCVDDSSAAFLVAAVTGDRSYLQPDVRADFSATGLAHMLALSGLHVGILASILAFLLLPLRWSTRGMALQAVVTALLVWIYAICTGLGPAVTRAAVMISVMILAYLIQRGHEPANSLLVAAVIVLAVDPMSLFSPGFQMSFMAVAMIMVAMSFIPNTLRRRPVVYYFVSAAVLSTSAMVGTGIIAAYHFGIFPRYFLLANIAAGLLAPWLIGCGFVIMALGMLGIPAAWLGWVASVLYRALGAIAHCIAALPGSNATGLHFSAWATAPYFMAIALAVVAVKMWGVRRHYGRPSVIMACAAAIMVMASFALSGCDKEGISGVSITLPSGSMQQGLLICSGNEAWVRPLCHAQYNADLQAHYSSRFSRYLAMRGCDSIQPAPANGKMGAVLSQDWHIIAPGLCLRVFEEGCSMQPSLCHVDYAIVAASYSGSVDAIIKACHPDTLIISAPVHAKRFSKLLRQCPDSLPLKTPKSQSLRFKIDIFD